MHEIKLVSYKPPEPGSPFTKDRYYRFWIPTAEFHFKSKRKMFRFIAELNRHLNSICHDVNFLVADVFREYRVYFFHLTTTQRVSLDSQFQAVSKMYRLMIGKSGSQSSNSYTYDWLRKILQYLEDILQDLQDNPVNTLSTIQRYRLENLLIRIELCRKRLEWWPPEGFEYIKRFGLD